MSLRVDGYDDVSKTLKAAERQGGATEGSLEGIGTGAERGAKKATGAFGRIGGALNKLRGQAKAGVNVGVNVDAGGAQAQFQAVDRAREGLDGKGATVNISARGAAGAIATFAAVGAAAAAMDAGLSAGGTRMVALGGAATVAAALFTPLLGGLAAVGGLAATAGVGFGLIGAAAWRLNEGIKAGEPLALAFRDAWEGVRLSLRNALTPAAEGLARLGIKVADFAQTQVPMIGAAATATMQAFSEGVTNALAVLSSPATQNALVWIFTAAAPVVEDLTTAVGNFAGGLISIFATAAVPAMQLAGYIRSVSDAFLSWSQSQAGRQQITAWIQSAIPVFKALWDMVKNVAGALVSFGTNNASSVAQAITIISTAVGFAIRAFGAFIGAIGPVGVVIAALAPLFVGVVFVIGTVASAVMGLVGAASGVVAAFGGWAVIGGFMGTWLGPAVLVIGALIAAGVALYRNWGTVKATLLPIFTAISNAIRTGLAVAFRFLRAQGTALVNWFRTAWPPVRAAVLPILTAIARGLRTALGTAFRFLLGQGRQLVAWFRASWPQLRAAVLPVVLAIGRGIRTALGAAFRFAISQGRMVVNFFRTNWPLIRRTAATVFNFVKTVITANMRAIGLVIRTVWGAAARFWNTNSRQILAIARSVWQIIKTVISTAIKVVLGVIKATMQAITGDWRGAWNTIKEVVRTVWEAIKTVVRAAIDIVKNVIQVAWNTIKDITSAAWEAVRGFIADKIEAARAAVADKANALKQAALDAWNVLKDGTRDAFIAIGEFMWRPIEDAYTQVITWLDKIIGAVNGILEKVGIDPIPLVGQGGGVPDRPTSTRGPNARVAMARGGVLSQGPSGGVATSPRVVYGEAGAESYVTLDRYTPESAHALATANRRWAQRGWMARGGIVGYRPDIGRREARAHRRSDRGIGYVSGSGEGYGPTHYNVQPHIKERADKIAAAVGGSWNTYGGHGVPGGSSEDVTFDVWGPGGRGDPLYSAGIDQAAEMGVAYSDIMYAIANGNMFRNGNWFPFPEDPHYDHTHLSYGGGKGATGGFNPMRALFDKLWDATIKPMADAFIDPLKGSENVMLQATGTLAQKIPEGIKEWVYSKLPATGGDTMGFSGGGDAAANRALGEKMNAAKGWASHWGALDAMWIKESGWDRFADNPTSDAYGIPQGMMGPGGSVPPPGYMPPESDAAVQIAWGLDYIAGRYGDPSAAWSFHQANGYYGDGGMAIRPQTAVVGDAGRELMLPLENRAVMQQARQTFGTHAIEARLASLESAFISRLDRGLDINDLKPPASEKILVSGRNGARDVLGSREGREFHRGHAESLSVVSRTGGRN